MLVVDDLDIKKFNPVLFIASHVCALSLDEETDPSFKVITWRKKKLTRMNDWGLVVIGLDRLNPEFSTEVFDLIQGTPILFQVDPDINLSKILGQLCAFSSASQARKNGWNKKIPVGFSHHQFKIDRAMGELTILNLVGSDWEIQE